MVAPLNQSWSIRVVTQSYRPRVMSAPQYPHLPSSLSFSGALERPQLAEAPVLGVACQELSSVLVDQLDGSHVVEVDLDDVAALGLGDEGHLHAAHV